VSVGVQALQSFIEGNDLSANIKSKLVAELWNGHAVYDAER